MAAAAGLGVLLETTAARQKQQQLRPAAAPPARTTPAAQTISKATVLNAAAKNNDISSVSVSCSSSSAASRAPMPPATSFLQRCFVCRRELADGRDIYIYRGDRAFCSEECRCRHILVEDDDDDCGRVAAAELTLPPAAARFRVLSPAEDDQHGALPTYNPIRNVSTLGWI